MTVVEPEATPLVENAPRAPEAPVLRADDGEINHAPAFLQVRPAEARAEGDAEVRRPRRRRTPRALKAGMPRPPQRTGSTIRWVMVFVFPAPAPATIKSGPCICKAASFCSLFRPSR